MASLDALIEAAKYVECKKEGGVLDERGVGCPGVSASHDLDIERSLISFRRRPGGAGTRETHNKLEKFRRAHLKECFEKLRQHVPTLGSRKASNLSILKEALKYIEILKEKDRKFEAQREKLMKCHKCLVERIKMFEEDMKREGVQQSLPVTAVGSSFASKEAPVIVALKQDHTQVNHSGGVYVCVLAKRNSGAGDCEKSEPSREIEYKSVDEHVDVVA